MFSRQQLDLLIQKKKIDEVLEWFRTHFIESNRDEYLLRPPFVILQGPTGSGKSSVLRWIAQELRVPIKDFDETSDLTSITNEIRMRKNSLNSHSRESNPFKYNERFKTERFEQFVINNVRYNSLISLNLIPADSDDEDEESINKAPLEPNHNNNKQIPGPVMNPHGIIIHIESQLSFLRDQRQTIQTMCRLHKMIKEISKRSQRRVAIVFETIEGDNETLMLPQKTRALLGIPTFKFNPITKSNMEKLVKLFINKLNQERIDKNQSNVDIHLSSETVEQLVNDSDGDMSACLSTLELICNNEKAYDDNIPSTELERFNLGKTKSQNYHPSVNKRQKLSRNRQSDIRRKKEIILAPSLLRDTTKSVVLFHLLGKIFYQKRLYPEYGFTTESINDILHRPFPLENSTESLLDLLHIQSKNLLLWLHHHYTRFCDTSNISKAGLFTENISEVDLISLNATQLSQFFESHYLMDQLQSYTAIEATTFSLYKDQSRVPIKKSHKKVVTPEGTKIVKSSVEICGDNWGDDASQAVSATSRTNQGLYTFHKPTSMSLPNLIHNQRKLIDSCYDELHSITGSLTCIDTGKLVTEYLPYVDSLAKLWKGIPISSKQENFTCPVEHPIYDKPKLAKKIDMVVKLDNKTSLSPDEIEFRIELIKGLMESSEEVCDNNDLSDWDESMDMG